MFAADVEPRSSTHSGVSASHTRESSPRLLERRVSFWAPCAVVASVQPEEPRKNFMKFWVTDAIRTICRFARGDGCPKTMNQPLKPTLYLIRGPANSYFPAAFSALPCISIL